MKLRVLLTQRSKLVKAIGAFRRTNEITDFLPKKLIKEALEINNKALGGLKKHLKKIDDLIKELIESDEQLLKVSTLARSVPGVGKQTAAYLIAYTRAFTAFDNWRKLACYAGIAPFEYSSGSSIRGKTQLNQMANKKLKSILNMAAISAIQFDPQVKAYYQRKVAEGKNKMSVINAVRCKVVSRTFATVKRGTPYVKLETFS